MTIDRLYDYTSFSDDRLKNILTSWDGLGGYHGLLIKKVSELIPPESSILDVGCGLCHLFEALKSKNVRYTGLEYDTRIVEWARERYPTLKILHGSMYNLSNLGMFNCVTAIGVYSGEPESPSGVIEMLRHTDKKLILTYFKKNPTPTFLNNIKYRETNTILHNIDTRLEIREIHV